MLSLFLFPDILGSAAPSGDMEVVMAFNHNVDNLWTEEVMIDLKYNLNKCYKNINDSYLENVKVNTTSRIQTHAHFFMKINTPAAQIYSPNKQQFLFEKLEDISPLVPECNTSRPPVGNYLGVNM